MESTLSTVGPNIGALSCESNTQDINTDREAGSENQVIPDYVAWTYRAEEVPKEALAVLFGSEGWQVSIGLRFYRQSVRKGAIRCYFDGIGGCAGTVHVVMAGEACRQLEGMADFPGWRDWFSLLLAQDCRVTRFDLCCDDRRGLLSLETIKQAVFDGHLASTYSRSKGLWERDIRQGRDLGETVYLGSRQGDSIIRFYDRGRKIGAESFVRCEVELHDLQAQNALRMIVGGQPVGILYAGIVGKKADFKQPGRDTNRSRWARVDWWQSFLGHAEKLALGVGAKVCSVKSKLEWLARAVAPTLAVMEELMPDAYWLDGLIGQARERLGDKVRQVALNLADQAEAPSLYREVIERAEQARERGRQERREREESRQRGILERFFGEGASVCSYDLYHAPGALA